jgi:hypothetical protein
VIGTSTQGGPGEPVRHVEGRVVRGTREKQLPVVGQWVVLHRVGPDHAGPLDSVRTSASGGYAMRYRPSGDTTALYFTSTSYGGVAYFTAPLRALDARGDDALLTVFDTTSGPVAIKIGGRHIIVGAAAPNATRSVGEVYDLQNDSTVTLVARDTTSPLWTTHIPADARSPRVNSGGTIAASAMTFRGGIAGLYAPLSPGIRQVAFTYDLTTGDFPLAVPVERATGVLEIMVEEPRARVDAPHLREVAPVSADGRTFRRFLAQDLDADAVVRIDVPPPPRAFGKVYLGIDGVIIGVMLVAVLFALRRRRSYVRPTSPIVAQMRESNLIAQRIAELDDMFERNAALESEPSDRESYQTQRGALKQRLAQALADEKRKP